MNMLRKLRIILATISFILITLLFLDFTGTLHAWFGWMAKLQFLPALLASSFVIVAAIVVITLLFGRIYCSIICPLGVYQDGVSRIAEKIRKNRYKFRRSYKKLRNTILIVFVVFLILGTPYFIKEFAPYSYFGKIISNFIAPYSIYGRIASNLFSPIILLINNVLAYFAERWDSYAFYSVDVYIKSMPVFIISIAYFLIITLSAVFFGRGYCNTVCPVGTFLSFFSRHSLLKPHFDTEKCNSCGLCEKNCRCTAIDSKNHIIDYSKCVTCFVCVDKCNRGAMKYGMSRKACEVKKTDDVETEGKTTRKTFITTITAIAAASALKAQEKVVDGGLAKIIKKEAPKRKMPLKPAGSRGFDDFTSRCTGCQLCVQACPNGVLRPSTSLETFMQPEMSFERNYCRPECTACSEVCPAGAIRKVTREEKTSISIGHAVWTGQNCVPLRDGVECGNCARHCPAGAIKMMPFDPNDETSPKVPSVMENRCIGCGACEHVCPTRPFSAIYVEGNEKHITI